MTKRRWILQELGVANGRGRRRTTKRRKVNLETVPPHSLCINTSFRLRLNPAWTSTDPPSSHTLPIPRQLQLSLHAPGSFLPCSRGFLFTPSSAAEEEAAQDGRLSVGLAPQHPPSRFTRARPPDHRPADRNFEGELLDRKCVQFFRGLTSLFLLSSAAVIDLEMASDSTYLFFRRESDEAGGTPHAPVINTTRVVKRGGLRGASVPPIHLGARASRAGSVSSTRGFVRPTPVIHTVSSTSSSHIGGSRFSLAAPSTSSVSAVPFASLSGYQPRPVARRASIAAPGGSTLRIWSVGNTAPSSGSSSLTRGLTEVTKVGGGGVGLTGAGAGARSFIYRPSTQAGFGRSTALVRVGGGQPQASVGGRSAAGGGTGSSGRLSRSQVSLYPRGSVSGFGGSHWDADPRLDPLGKTQHRSAYVGGGGAGGGSGAGGSGGVGGGAGGRGWTGRSSSKSESSRDLSSSFSSGDRYNRKSNDFTSGEGVARHPVKASDNDVHHSKKHDYEKQMADLLPVHEDSLAKLRARAQVAKDHLSRHRILLDRYLPLQLGPDTDVGHEVEARYGELLSRMPHLDRRQKDKDKDEYISVIPPYKPASTTSRSPKLSYDIVNTPVSKSFTPKISDTRKRARSVLCKVKGDPKYFDF